MATILGEQDVPIPEGEEFEADMLVWDIVPEFNHENGVRMIRSFVDQKRNKGVTLREYVPSLSFYEEAKTESLVWNKTKEEVEKHHNAISKALQKQLSEEEVKAYASLHDGGSDSRDTQGVN